MSHDYDAAALEYHALKPAGKLRIEVTKPCDTFEKLCLAYTPGVAAPVRAIAANPEDAYRYTAKGNLVAVISNGTAVLGLGNMGPLASKPVMEGKAVLFKRFADIDVFDIEIDAHTPAEIIDTVRRIAPTFGGINLEDIAAPHCFEVEEALVEALDIPVFHDDQHGTAIIVCAGLLNALDIQGKNIGDVTIAILGAGAAAVASAKLLRHLGVNPDKLLMLDRQGVIHSERGELAAHKQTFAVNTDKRSVTDALQDADVFIGLSGPDLVTADMIKTMAPKPVIFALSNPDPEISPELAHSVRDDLIMATGRSDYPNQVNNVLGFPFIFRGALDVRARRITPEMHVAAVEALKSLAREEVPQAVLDAYGRKSLAFGADYIIPTPLDPRLIDIVPPAVAQAAVESGVARSGYPSHYPDQKTSSNAA